jgi:CRP-like cAMP-binding protein
MAAMRAKRKVTAAQLGRVGFFDGLVEADLQNAAVLADEIAVPAGYVLVYDGDWRPEVFVVVEGRAEVRVGANLLDGVGRGAVIDASTGVPGVDAPVTVTAATSMRLFQFHKAAFDAFTARHPLLVDRVRPPERPGWMAPPGGLKARNLPA